MLKWPFPFILAALLFFSCNLQASEDSSLNIGKKSFHYDIDLTENEKNWLEQNPVIRARVGSNPPLHFFDGQNRGVSVDFLNLIAEIAGFQVEYVHDIPWSIAIEDIKKGETFDLLLTAKNSKERRAYMRFSDDYLLMPWVIFARINSDFIGSVEDLNGRTVAVEKSFVMQKRLMKEYPEINLLERTHSRQALESVASGEADAYIGNLATSSYIIGKYNLTNLKVACPALLGDHNQSFAVRYDWPEFVSILNKGIKAIPAQQLKELRNKWFNVRFENGNTGQPQLPVNIKMDFTKSEQVWLSQNKSVRLWITDYPPYIILKKNGQPEGIVIDSLKLIAERTGVKFNFVTSDDTFREAIQGIKNHQGPDVIATVVKTPGREKFILFTRDFMKSPYMIFMRADTKRIIAGIDDLKGKKLALLKGGVLQEMTERDYPEVKLVLFGSHLEAIDAVATGEAEAYIGDLTRTSYQILQHGYYNIRRAAPSPFGDQILSMGVRDDWPELASILDKGLATISPEKFTESRNRYISLQFDQPDTAKYIKWILIVIGSASGIILLFFFWNRSLSRKVTARTSELQESEETLKEKSDFLDKVIESAALSTWISDEKGSVIRANPACLTFFGATEDEIVGKYNLFQDVVIEKNGFMPDIKNVFEKGQHANIVLDYDFRAVDHVHVKNATHKTINSIFTPIKDGSGKVSNVIVQTIDLTDIKKMEKELMQSRKMESIGNLAGGIAHDFNNILASILGFTELALDEAEKGSYMEENLQEIYAGGQRAKEIVKQILAFARQSDEQVKPTRVDTIIIEALKLIRPSTPTTIEIRKEIDSSSRVMGNATQIHQIMINLCTNAAHAMQNHGGIMEVSLKDTFLTEITENNPKDLREGKYIELIISDTGGGIAPEHIDSIFDPYFTTKKTGEGTGMGLAMVRGIIDSYGGKIMVESNPSVKTVFTIYLPVSNNQDHTVASGSDEALVGGSESILFVDDEPAITRMGSRILESLGYTVTSKTNSLEALELFRANPDRFALVITDMTMPHMTGDKFTIELRRIREDIRIILCTGYSNKISAESALEIGINAFTYKPFSKADLANTVRDVLDNV